MFDKLKAVEERYDKLMLLVSDAAVQADPAEYRTHTKALAEIQPLVDKFREYKTIVSETAQAKELTEGDDAELRELAEQELHDLEPHCEELLAEIRGTPPAEGPQRRAQCHARGPRRNGRR